MQTSLQHAVEEDLEQFSLGMLAEAEAEIIEEHLLICPACQDRLTEMDAYLRTMQAALRKARQPRPWGWFHFSHRASSFPAVPGFAWAAAAAICLALLFWVSGIRNLPLAGGPPPVAVTLQAMRGAESAATAPSGRPLALQADVAGLPLQTVCLLEVVDARGEPARQSQVKLEGTRVTLPVKGLDAGSYWVRLYAPGPQKELLREYALRVQ